MKRQAKKKWEHEESLKKIEEYNKNKLLANKDRSEDLIDADKLEKEKSEKRRHFLENALLKKGSAKQPRKQNPTSSPALGLKVEGPRSKKPTLATRWRLEKTGQKVGEE